jgi:hypothetical protein
MNFIISYKQITSISEFHIEESLKLLELAFHILCSGTALELSNTV